MTANYAQTLRAIGQALELWHLQDFDLENCDNTFLVRGNGRAPPKELSMLQTVLRRWRRPRAELLLHYTAEDIEQLDQQGQLKRRDPPHSMPDFYSLPQLLRTIGAYVDLKGARLLGLSKREVRLTLQYEKVKGQRKIENDTIASYYDLFLRMYLRRSNRGS